MKLELKRISVWAAVKVSFLLNLILGFIIGLFMAFFFALIASLPMSLANEESAGLFSAFAGVAAIFLPFFYAFFCAIFNTALAAIMVLAYNLVVKLTGGLEFEFKQVVEMVPAVAQASFTPPSSGGDQQSTI